MIPTEHIKCRVPTLDAIKAEWIHCSTSATNASDITGDIATWVAAVGAIVAILVSLNQSKRARVEAIKDATTSRLIDSSERWTEKYFWLGHTLSNDRTEFADRIQSIKSSSSTLKMHLGIQDREVAESFRAFASDVRKVQELKGLLLHAGLDILDEYSCPKAVIEGVDEEIMQKDFYATYRVFVRKCAELVQNAVVADSNLNRFAPKFYEERAKLRATYPQTFFAIETVEEIDGTLGF